MKTIGRYIAAFLLAVPAAGVVAIAILLLVLWVSQTAGISSGVFSVAFFIGLVTFTQLFSMILDNWRDRNIAIRLITALPISLFLALSPALMIGAIAEYVISGWDNGGNASLPAFIIGFVVCALWLARSSTGRQATSRVWGLIALTAFAIPSWTIGYVIVTPPPPDPLIHPFFAVIVAIIVCAPVGIISAIIWYDLRRERRQEIPIGYNESRNWRG